MPAVVGYLDSYRRLVATQTDLRVNGGDFPLAQYARIISDLSSERLIAVAVGCAMAGALAVLAGWQRPPTAKPRWLYVGIAISVAVVARVALVPQLRPLDAVTLVLIAVAAVLLARTNELRLVIVIVAGVVLLDIAAKLAGIGDALESIAGDSVDTDQAARILGRAIAEENRRYASIVLDVALLIGFCARPKRAPVRLLQLGIAVVVLLALTPLQWLGLGTAIADLSITVAQRGGGPSFIPLTDDSLRGPAVSVRNGNLEAAPSADVPLAPYNDVVAKRMAEAQDDRSPLLLTTSANTLGNVMASLDPLLKRRQVDYQLVVSNPSYEGYGVYGAILDARDFVPRDVDLVPHSDAKNAIVLSPSTRMDEVARAVAHAPKTATERTIVTVK